MFHEVSEEMLLHNQETAEGSSCSAADPPVPFTPDYQLFVTSPDGGRISRNEKSKRPEKTCDHKAAVKAEDAGRAGRPAPTLRGSCRSDKGPKRALSFLSRGLFVLERSAPLLLGVGTGSSQSSRFPLTAAVQPERRSGFQFVEVPSSSSAFLFPAFLLHSNQSGGRLMRDFLLAAARSGHSS
ncbi:hypothetical protein FQA47_016101 [Oryzias melastigma]|uniref:Uncharacterized protein n=1 Tax=Oryzias melastigma TaxID=30732 RepID=A0A834L0F9_ORYME|nr:hypothetical protein FQA47_016101 [Oryzias melastigma]